MTKKEGVARSQMVDVSALPHADLTFWYIYVKCYLHSCYLEFQRFDAKTPKIYSARPQSCGEA